MAEPLETLLQMTARKRPQRLAQFRPQTTVGDTGITSQALADSAQGVDISNAYPNTRLRADRIEDVYGVETPVNLPQEGGGEKSPFQLLGGEKTPMELLGTRMDTAKVQGAQCEGGNCYRQPALSGPSITATALPPGVELGPGETYVPDSLREVTASAAPATAAPRATVPQPPQSAGMQPYDKTGINPQFYLNQSLDLYRQAQGAASASQAVQAMLFKSQAQESAQIGMAAAVLRKKEEIANLTAQIGERQLGLQERRLGQEDEKLRLEDRKIKTETGEIIDEILAGKRAARDIPVQARARDIVLTRAAWAQKAGIVTTPEQLKQQESEEMALLSAMDMGHYLEGVLSGERAIASAAAAGQDPSAARARTLMLHGKMNELMAARFRDIADPSERAVRMKQELTPVFEAAFSKAAKEAGAKIGADEIQARTIDQVELLISDLDQTMQGADPYRLYWQHMQARQESPYRRAVMSAAEPEPEPIQWDSTLGAGYEDK